MAKNKNIEKNFMPIKLDYSLQSPEERNDLVKKIVENTPPEQLSNKYLEILSDYIIFAMDKQERRTKKILTDNRMITVNKRETSFQGLASKLENGEDGIYSMITNDKNILFTPRISITEKDLQEIPGLRNLRSSIEEVEKEYSCATGKRKFLLKRQLIEMRQDQYVLKNSYRQPLTYFSGVRSLINLSLEEDITMDEQGEPQSNGLITFFNPKHISALLCNYSALKEDSWGKIQTDIYYMMKDLDDLVDETLKEKHPMYYDLVIYKIDGKRNIEIQALLQSKYNFTHSVEYISSLWRKKIPKMLSEQAKEDYIVWYYTYIKYGKWKRCSYCGQIKLAHNRFFSKNNTSKDHYYSICKKCRSIKAKERRTKLSQPVLVQNVEKQ